MHWLYHKHRHHTSLHTTFDTKVSLHKQSHSMILPLPFYYYYYYYYYYNHFTALCTVSGTTWVSRYQKGKTNLDLLEQETVSGCGISWSICKSAPRPRQITMPVPHHSVFYRPDALPATQSTSSKHCHFNDHYFSKLVLLRFSSSNCQGTEYPAITGKGFLTSCNVKVLMELKH